MRSTLRKLHFEIINNFSKCYSTRGFMSGRRYSFIQKANEDLQIDEAHLDILSGLVQHFGLTNIWEEIGSFIQDYFKIKKVIFQGGVDETMQGSDNPIVSIILFKGSIEVTFPR